MFYARAALNAKSRVTFGLRHIREFEEMQIILTLNTSRCFEPVSGHKQTRSYCPYHEVCLSKAVQTAQCVQFHR